MTLENAMIFTARKRGTFPAIECVACNGQLTATDLETTYVAYGAVAGLDGCYDGIQLKSFLAGNAVTASCGLEEFPANPGIEKPYMIGESCLVGDLKNQLERVVACVSDCEMRGSMNGVCFDNNDGYTQIIGTDGNRMYVDRLCIQTNSVAIVGKEAIIPRKAVLKIIKWLGKLGKSDSVLICFNDPSGNGAGNSTYVRLMSGIEVVYVKLTEGQFPDWKQVVDMYETKKVATFEVAAETLAGAVHDSAIVLTDEVKAQKWFLENGALKILGESPHGKAERIIELTGLKMEDSILETGFSAPLILAYCAGHKKQMIRVSICETSYHSRHNVEVFTRPVLLTTGKHADAKCMIMPCRFEN